MVFSSEGLLLGVLGPFLYINYGRVCKEMSLILWLYSFWSILYTLYTQRILFFNKHFTNYTHFFFHLYNLLMVKGSEWGKLKKRGIDLLQRVYFFTFDRNLWSNDIKWSCIMHHLSDLCTLKLDRKLDWCEVTNPTQNYWLSALVEVFYIYMYIPAKISTHHYKNRTEHSQIWTNKGNSINKRCLIRYYIAALH